MFLFLLISSSVVRRTIQNSKVLNRIAFFLIYPDLNGTDSEPIPRFLGGGNEPNQKSEINSADPSKNLYHLCPKVLFSTAGGRKSKVQLPTGYLRFTWKMAVTG